MNPFNRHAVAAHREGLDEEHHACSGCGDVTPAGALDDEGRCAGCAEEGEE